MPLLKGWDFMRKGLFIMFSFSALARRLTMPLAALVLVAPFLADRALAGRATWKAFEECAQTPDWNQTANVGDTGIAYASDDQPPLVTKTYNAWGMSITDVFDVAHGVMTRVRSWSFEKGVSLGTFTEEQMTPSERNLMARLRVCRDSARAGFVVKTP
jgi:hypothetical protein